MDGRICFYSACVLRRSGIGLPGYLIEYLWRGFSFPSRALIDRGRELEEEEEEEDSFLYALYLLGLSICTDLHSTCTYLSLSFLYPGQVPTLYCVQPVSIPPFGIPEAGSGSPSYV